jgi:hypothetical protein
MVTSDLVSEEEDITKLIIPDDLPDEQPAFKAYIEAKVYDKEGHLIQYHRQPMRSLTRYFLALMSIPILGTYQNASTNSAQNLIVNVLGLSSNISIGNGTANISWDFSIRLGSGTQTFSPTLTGLAAPIANGTGTGQLVYSRISALYVGSSIIVLIQVSNSTSSVIPVTEIGLWGIVYIQFYTGTSSYNFLLSYDTFSTAIQIPASGMAMFQITLSFTG